MTQEDIRYWVCQKEERPEEGTETEDTPGTNAVMQRRENDKKPEGLRCSTHGHKQGYPGRRKMQSTKVDRGVHKDWESCCKGKC